MKASRSRGFTLIELMITVVIIGVLASIAIPSYDQYLRKSRRSDAKAALMELAGRMEIYYNQNNSYVGAGVTTLMGSTASSEGYYTVSITTTGATTFTIQAAPTTGGVQVADTECASFTLTAAGVRGVLGTGSAADCW